MEPFKNEFSAAKARCIAERLKLAHPGFPMRRFLSGLDAALDRLELKPRVIHLAERIESCLPDDPRLLFPILVRALAADENDSDGLRGFSVWPLTEIVARRGLGHFKESMDALREMTNRFTAEFAIRPFLREHPEKTLRQLRSWCAHPDHHVRRLVSEGSRPFLPWGGNLPHLCEPPHPTLTLLEKLYRDPSDYVRLSVSNHLNDLSKRHPELVIDTLSRWRTEAKPAAQFEKLARHACRTLLKQGHPAALRFHGYASADSLEIINLELPRTRLRLGESLTYRVVVRNHGRRAVRVMFDYAIHHRKANGTLSPKVFKGRIREIEAGGTWEITGSHPIRQITTRVYHEGIHRFEPRLNGASHTGLEFTLKLR
jgi:3-methyladenine DNA glycosylase AlkC